MLHLQLQTLCRQSYSSHSISFLGPSVPLPTRFTELPEATRQAAATEHQARMMILTSWGTFSKCQKMQNQRKIAILTITWCGQESKFYPAPSYRRGQLFQDLFCAFVVQKHFPWKYMGKIAQTFNTVLRKYWKSVKQAYTTNSHRRWALGFLSSL